MSWQQPQAAANRVTTIPAPIGGLNARDSLVAMPEQDAITMRNWWPQPYGASVRRGYREWAWGMPAAVETLATWSSIAGEARFFAWSGTAMYETTSGGPVGAPIFTDLTNARWQSTVMTNTAGTHLLAVNGKDDGIIYNSDGAARFVAGDGTAPLTWAGLDPKKAVQLTTHQGRIWATEINSTKGWYLGVSAISGVLESFDFGPQFRRGGYLSFLATWTIDDGNGAEDHLVAVSSNGEAVVYGGTDPADDLKWSLVGVYTVGGPLGRRSYTKAGADLFLLTQRGVVAMSDLLSSTKVNNSESSLRTSKIQYLVAQLTSLYLDQFGWQLAYYPTINQLLINIPNSSYTGTSQLVSNQVVPEQPWAEFTNQYALCWGQFGVDPMFGARGGFVYRAWTGSTDKATIGGTNGTNITAELQQAYNYFGSPAVQKQVGMYRLNVISDVAVPMNTAISYDFATVSSTVPNATVRALPLADLPVGYWGLNDWDLSVWGGGSGSEVYPVSRNVQRSWVQAQGIGVAVSLAVVVSTNIPVLLVSTDFTYRVGGIL